MPVTPPAPLPPTTPIYAIKLSDVYDAVYKEILEETGATSGLVSLSDVVNYINLVVKELMFSTAMYRQLWASPIMYGTKTYDEPTYSTGARMAWVDNTLCQQENWYIWDQTEGGWRLNDFGFPNEWREGGEGSLYVELRPTPNFSGRPVSCSDINGMYGVISSTSLPVDIDITCGLVTGFIGTISHGDTGEVFIDCPGGLWGTVADMCCSTVNLMGTTVADLYWDMTDATWTQWLDMIPRSWTQYVVAGVLARVYSADSELKDTRLSQYWTVRYAEGISLGRSISGEITAKQ